MLLNVLVEQQRLWRGIAQAPRVFERALTSQPGATPSEVTFGQGRVTVRHYRPIGGARWAEPVLICYALVNRPYILDLLPGKSVVAKYLDAGFDVYLIDWGTPTAADRTVTLTDHVCGFLKGAVEHVLARHEARTLHLLGYCMGGTMAAAFAALEPAPVRSLTLLAAPIDFSGREALLNLWAGRGQFDVDAFVNLHGNCPAWFLQTCFLMMRPVQNLIEKNLALYERFDDIEAVSTHLAMERWNNDNIPVPGETFRQFVKELYQGNALVRGHLRLGDRRVDLARISCPVLLLTAENDHMVAPSSTEGIRPHLSSTDVQSLSVRAGHVGLVVGGKAHGQLWPQATRWLADRSTESVIDG